MTKTMTLQKQVLDRIKAQGVKPTSKSLFKLRDYMLWIFLGIFVAALGVGASMVVFMANGIDRGLYARLGLNVGQKLLYSVPFFWIAITIAIAVVAFINFRKTRKGYRMRARHIAVITAVCGAMVGSVVYAFNISKYIDRAATENIPLYSAIAPFNTNVWFNPEYGLLSGSVKIKESNESFTLRDQNFDLWTVTGEDVAIRPEEFKFESGDRIKIIGKKTGEFEFRVTEIRPWENEVKREPKQEAPSAI